MSVWDRTDPEEERREDLRENLEIGLLLGGAVVFVVLCAWVIRLIVQHVT